MTTVAFFGHDSSDAAIRRRVEAMKDDGLKVQGFMMRRGEEVDLGWDNVCLGQTHDGAFLERILRIVSGAQIAAKRCAELAKADVIYARNLDMLACAFLTKRFAKLDVPVIYECLDVHRLLSRNDFVGKALRWIEKSLLKRTVGLVVSSPGFLRNHFEKHYLGLYRPFLLENRIVAVKGIGARPQSEELAAKQVEPLLRIGWIGNLRCKRSFNLLCSLADRYPGLLEIRIHGQPARNEIPAFELEIDKRANMTFGGRYRSPEDLARIYRDLDLVWAGTDFMKADTTGRQQLRQPTQRPRLGLNGVHADLHCRNR
jgi:succinoglycan biosynthesis protein ExoL